MQPRILFQTLAIGEHRLDAPTSHHLAVVLRAQAGQLVTLFDGQGQEGQGKITAVQRSEVTVCVTAVEHVLRESPLAITVVQSLCTGDKMDWVIQKATELGAAVIVPLAAARSVLKLEGVRAAKRVAHWAAIAQAASAQSGRTLVPRIRPIQTLHEVLDEWRHSPSPKTGVHLDPFAAQGLSEAQISGPITLMIGPEAGWSDDEEVLMQRAGFRGVRCGPRILRTETAALVALTALAIRAGEF